jgi:hypothetical protein
MTENTDVLDARHAITEATRHTSHTLLNTAPVLDAAAALLAEVWTTGERHGVHPAGWDIAFACLDAMKTQWCAGRPQTIPEAQDLQRALLGHRE